VVFVGLVVFLAKCSRPLVVLWRDNVFEGKVNRIRSRKAKKKSKPGRGENRIKGERALVTKATVARKKIFSWTKKKK